MVVSAAGYEFEAGVLEGRGERPGVVDDLPRIDFEFWSQGFAEGDGLRCDDMHQRSALEAREHRGIDLLRDVGVIGQDKAAARTAQGLMSRRGDDMRVREWRGVRAARDQPGEMRHIDEKI